MPKTKAKPKTPSLKRSKPAPKSKPKIATEAQSRKFKISAYKSFRIHKKIKSDLPILPSAIKLFWRSLQVLWKNKRLFLGIVVVYGLLNLILVHGLASNGDLGSLKSSLSNTFLGTGGKIGSSLTLYAYLLGGGSNTSSASASAGIYQTLLIILVSLALIWSLRQVYAAKTVRVRDSFYQGLYPLVPFILVLLVICLELLPLIIGGFLYSTVISNGIAVYAIEKVLWGLLFFLLGLLSLYMISSSAFALYVVTLPDMTPMKALKSARELVRHRRFLVLRKLLFLPLALIILAAIIMVPVIIIATPLAEWLYFAITIVGLAVINSYMYALYRELLP